MSQRSFAFRFLLSVFALGSTLVGSDALHADEIASWKFQDGTGGWNATHQCNVVVTDGVLTVKSSGKDPQMVTRVAGPAGWKKLTVEARKGGGRLRGQVFWTTEKQPETSEAASVRFDWMCGTNSSRSSKSTLTPLRP